MFLCAVEHWCGILVGTNGSSCPRYRTKPRAMRLSTIAHLSFSSITNWHNYVLPICVLQTCWWKIVEFTGRSLVFDFELNRNKTHLFTIIRFSSYLWLIITFLITLVKGLRFFSQRNSILKVSSSIKLVKFSLNERFCKNFKE